MYKCQHCGHQFRSGNKPTDELLWSSYQNGKQTIAELANLFDTSESSIKRRLRAIRQDWVQPILSGSGFVHLDASYWGHNWGVMLAVDSASGFPLYMSLIKHETIADYRTAVSSIEERGYAIRGIIIDDMPSLFKEFRDYNVQMCHFHMMQIARRYLTKKPKLLAAREQKSLLSGLTDYREEEFGCRYATWEKKWKETIDRRTTGKNDRSFFTHKRLRTLVNSIHFYMPYLFTFQHSGCEGMPNTNNKIEGIFTDLKKNLNNHSGMSIENRKRFINEFFLALANTNSLKKRDPI